MVYFIYSHFIIYFVFLILRDDPKNSTLIASQSTELCLYCLLYKKIIACPVKTESGLCLEKGALTFNIKSAFKNKIKNKWGYIKCAIKNLKSAFKILKSVVKCFFPPEATCPFFKIEGKFAGYG